MLIVTTPDIAGYRIMDVKGQVFGGAIRRLSEDLKTGLRSLLNGDTSRYIPQLEDTRRHAINRMTQNARAMGANAVVMMRFDTSAINEGMGEVMAYGTAVVVEKCE